MADLLGRQTVTDSDGRSWTVGVRWLPRAPRWLGWGRGRRSSGGDAQPLVPPPQAAPPGTALDTGEAKKKRRRSRTSWLDGFEVLDVFDDPGPTLVIIAVVGVALLAWFFVLPLAILLLDLVFVLLLAVAGVAVRVLFRRPWIVEAVSGDARLQWPVVGWRASRRSVAEVTQALQLGHHIETVVPAQAVQGDVAR